jgi:glutaredoxin
MSEGPAVTLFHAEGCHLCEQARKTLVRLRGELGFAYSEVDITGRPELEAVYREWLPVVEIDGARAFVYHLDEAALRRRLAATQVSQADELVTPPRKA